MPTAPRVPDRVGLRRSIWIWGIVGLVGVAGIALGSPVGTQAPTHAVFELGKPTYFSLVCQGALTGPIYYLNIFPIDHIIGSAKTSQFGLSMQTATNQTFQPQGLAPGPTANLPCGAPPPKGWYAILLAPRVNGTIVTYPTVSYTAPGGLGWSNASFDPSIVPLYARLLIITGGDVSGSGDHLVAFGVDGSTVALAGNTTVPGFENP